jgi:hypothetical protein
MSPAEARHDREDQIKAALIRAEVVAGYLLCVSEGEDAQLLI